MLKTISFTPKQANALNHRLSCYDCLEGVFQDTPWLMHLVPFVWDRATELSGQLDKTSTITVNSDSQLDREILFECIEGSTWVGVHDYPGASKRSVAAARTTLKQLTDKIAPVFNRDPEDIFKPDY
jgi:hypothetical protein